MSSFTWMYFGFLLVPAFIYISLLIVAVCATSMRRTSVSRHQTTNVGDCVCAQWSTRRVSASSWVLVIPYISRSGMLQNTILSSWSPPAVTTHLFAGARLSNSWGRKLVKSALFLGSDRNPCQSWGNGTSGVSITLQIGLPFFLFVRVPLMDRQSYRSKTTSMHVKGKPYWWITWRKTVAKSSNVCDIYGLPILMTRAWPSITKKAASGTSYSSAHFIFMHNASISMDFVPVLSCPLVSAIERGTGRSSCFSISSMFTVIPAA